MEKILRNAVFLLGFFLSCASFAEVEETYTYGTKTSTGPLSFGDWYKEWLLLGGAGAHAQVAGSEYSNYRADIEKRKYCKANNYPTNVSFCAGYKEAERAKKKQECKVGLETSLRETKNGLLRDYRSNTSTCNNYHYLATASGIVGAVAAVPTFGFTAAAGMSGAVSFATAGVICQQNADGRYAELIAYNESVTRESDLKVCDQI